MDYVLTFLMPSALQWQNCLREQAHPTFDTLYTLTKKLEAGQLVRTHWYASSSDIYREKHRCYPVPAGRVAALEEEGVA